MIESFQVTDKGFTVFPTDILQALANLVNDAVLDGRLREDALDRLLEASQVVITSDEDVLGPARLKAADHAQPEVSALPTIVHEATLCPTLTQLTIAVFSFFRQASQILTARSLINLSFNSA